MLKAKEPEAPATPAVLDDSILPRNIVHALPCEGCGKPITAADCPVVLEWGKKDADSPSHIGRPWKRVKCHDCNRADTGYKPREKKEAPAAAKEGSKRVFPKREQPVRKSSGKLVGKIYLKVKENPRKPGTHGYNSFNLVKDGMTVEAYLQAGGRQNDLRWDIDHGWAEVR